MADYTLPHYWSPAKIGINGVSTKATTTYTGNVINVLGLRAFQLLVKQVNVGGTNPTTGQADLFLDIMDEDGTTTLATKTIIGGATKILTQGTTAASPGVTLIAALLSWDSLTTTPGTLLADTGVNPAVDNTGLFSLGPIRFRLQTTVVTDGTTTSLAYVSLRGSQ